MRLPGAHTLLGTADGSQVNQGWEESGDKAIILQLLSPSAALFRGLRPLHSPGLQVSVMEIKLSQGENTPKVEVEAGFGRLVVSGLRKDLQSVTAS